MSERYIYESPDGGKTVYARKFGQKDRILIRVNQTYEISNVLSAEAEEEQLWYDIRQVAKSNAAIQKALDRVIILYKVAVENSNDRKDPT